MTNPHDLIPNTDKIWNDIDAPYTGVPLPVRLSRINPYGSDRFSALFTLSLRFFLIQITSYHRLRAEHLFKTLLPQAL
jgi:hypothetical protein